MTDFHWTAERVERLRALFADKKSASEIANVFGGVSRSAVLGKLHRLGLTRERGHKPETAPRKSRVIITRANTNSNGMRVSIAHEPASFAKLRTVDVVSQAVDLLDLSPNGCRYPDGDPATFCNHPQTEGSSYCRSHDALCTAPPWRR